jgi:hypothetical protein
LKRVRKFADEDYHLFNRTKGIFMMKYFFLVFVAGVLATGCGEKAKEMGQAMDNIKNIAENAEKIQSQQSDVQKLRDERRAKGDTLAIAYKDLQAYLPASVDGYTAMEPTGESVNMMGMSYSTCGRRFTKQGANGEESVDITLMDYNSQAALYDGVVLIWGAGITIDNDSETMKSLKTDLPYSAAMEHYWKKEKRSEVIYALGGRFLLTIKADNQNSVDQAKNIANAMKLSELANK